MRHTVGGSWACLTLLALVACSSPELPPPEGLVTITNGDACGLTGQIAGPGGLPTGSSLGANETVLDGRDGVNVTCSIKAKGGNQFDISAKIWTSEMTVEISQGTVTGGATPSGTAQMYLTTRSSLNTYGSTENCTITAANGVYKVEAGSLWAQYNCASVQDPQNPTKICSPRGTIIVTGCSR